MRTRIEVETESKSEDALAWLGIWLEQRWRDRGHQIVCSVLAAPRCHRRRLEAGTPTLNHAIRYCMIAVYAPPPTEPRHTFARARPMNHAIGAKAYPDE